MINKIYIKWIVIKISKETKRKINDQIEKFI